MYRYINLRAQYCFHSDPNEGYCSVSEILQQMDRLGIWQTTAEFTGSANTVYRAERLLLDLKEIPNWRQRIIPCFMTDPAVLFETGALERFRDILQQSSPCCISLYPKQQNYRLRMMDMLLDQLKDACSVIMIDRSELNCEYASDDIVYLANRYPQISFVVRQTIWGGYALLIDIMSRAKNIYADSSRLHTRCALEMFTQHFGEERVLFSTDIRGNEGAAMAAITFAEISDAAKEKIRHENFIRLFPKEDDRRTLTENLKAIPHQIPNRFWGPFVNEGKAPDVDIYDVHCHIGVNGCGWFLPDANMEQQVDAFEKDIKKFNLKKIVSSVSGRPDLIEANLAMAEAVDGRERFLGYIRYNPNYDELYTDEYLESLLSSGYFIGLKTLPSYMGIDIRDSRYDRMFRFAHEHKLPILVHSWNNSPGTPKFCAEAAARWPDCKMILGHSGGGEKGRKECEELAQDPKYSNVYFEFCGSFLATRTWATTLKSIDYRRVLYGTDAALHSMAWEMGRLLSADITDEQVIAILGENAKRIYGFQ